MSAAKPEPGTVREHRAESARCANCGGWIERTPPIGPWWHHGTAMVDCPWEQQR